MKFEIVWLATDREIEIIMRRRRAYTPPEMLGAFSRVKPGTLRINR